MGHKIHIQTYGVVFEANYTEHYDAFYTNVLYIHLAATSVGYFIETLSQIVIIIWSFSLHKTQTTENVYLYL